MDDDAASPVGRLDSPVDKRLICPVDECIPVEICSPSRWLIGKWPDDSYCRRAAMLPGFVLICDKALFKDA